VIVYTIVSVQDKRGLFSCCSARARTWTFQMQSQTWYFKLFLIFLYPERKSIYNKKYLINIQILAPNADACGQHPDQTGLASLRQDSHRAECNKITYCVILAKESDCRGGKSSKTRNY